MFPRASSVHGPHSRKLPGVTEGKVNAAQGRAESTITARDAVDSAARAPQMASDPLINLVVDGRYRVLSRMARGGMASVYVARDERLDRPVALKLMHPHLAESEQFTARFRQEARAAARISHPGVVPVFDQGTFHGQGYLVMELVNGPDLRAFVQSTKPITLGQSLAFTEEILAALCAAHQAGVVHRDLKPENVLVAEDGTLKITDFGLSRAASEVSLSTTGSIMGTVAYLAPEVALRGSSDGRTDIYAVGIMLFELLTGELPGGSAVNPVQMALTRVNQDVPAPSTVVDWLPSEVDDLVQSFCSRNPVERPVSARDALAQVRRARAVVPDALLSKDLPHLSPATTSGEPGQVTAVHSRAKTSMLRIEPNVVHTSGSLVRPEDKQMSSSSRLPLILITVFLLLAGLALGFWWWWQQYGPGAYLDLPDLEGKAVAQAEATLTEMNLASVIDYEHSDEVPEGSIIRTDPGGGSAVHKNEEVTLVVSSGVLMLGVPTTAGDPLEDAKKALTDAGFEVGSTSEEWSETVPEGSVVSTVPKASEEVAHYTPVDIVVSKGRQPLPIPEVLGMTTDEATAALLEAGFQVDSTTGYSYDYAAGTVSAVSPAAGETLFRGETVTITVSLGPEYVEVPDVTHRSTADAIELLKQHGLEAEVERLADFFDTVGGQNPQPGTSVRTGSTVKITVV